MRHKIKLIIALFFFCLGLNYLVLQFPFTIFNAPSDLVYDRALVSHSQATKPSTKLFDDATQVALPDDWFTQAYSNQQKWYRLTLSKPKHEQELWAVYLPTVTHNVSIYVNNQWIGQSGGFDEPVSRHHNKPLLFTFAANLLSEDINHIDIRVKASHPSQGLLGEIYIGLDHRLRDAYEFKYVLRVELIKWISISMFILGLISFSFWLARPQDTTYGFFALLLFIWGLHNLNLFVSNIPTSAHFWEAMTMSTLGWMVVSMILFNHRYIGVSAPKVERVCIIFAFLGLLIFTLPNIGSILNVGYKIWDSFLIVFGSYAVYILLKVFWQTPNIEVYLMLLVGSLILALGMHDILVVNHLWDRTEGLIIQYSAIPTLLLFSWFLTLRFVQSIRDAENLAATLEQRVIEKTTELEQQFERLQNIKQEQTLAAERERIMRDMHDGIGGQLVSIAASLQDRKGEVFQQLLAKVQASINDLRMVIDSMDPMLTDLASLLGNARPRLEQQVSAANIRLIWDVNLLEELKTTPGNNLHLLRIIHEAVTNAIKHAQCEHIKISSFIDSHSVIIVITDNGIGFTQDHNAISSQRGLSNMQYRAEKINALLSIQSDESGTCISITVNR